MLHFIQATNELYISLLILTMISMAIPPHRRHWMKHTAMVPKGFIRYHVLESLAEKPMAGSEIMDEIERRTNGCWKPSPGSIYPLLAWLQDSGYVKELPTDQSGLKRYELTDSGRALLEEQRKIRAKFRKEARFFAPPSLGALWFRIPSEKTVQLRGSVHKLMMSFFELGSNLEEKFSEQALEEASKVLNDAAEKLEKINKRLGSKKDGRRSNQS
jgi:DNA-binding PadR family transcriptional regulator